MSSSILHSLSLDNDQRVLPPKLQAPSADGHKYDRGHVAVMSGPAFATGAARLAAQAAAGMGAGLVTVFGEREALAEHAAHLTGIMLAETKIAFGVGDRRVDAFVIGPGHGGGAHTRELVAKLLASDNPAVLDADALTAFEGDPETLFAMCHERVVMTPHMGEFGRLFGAGTTIEDAAKRARCTVMLKGSTTHIASPDGRHAMNDHSSPWLATAGSGDVLAGMVAALLGQGCDPFEASCAAAWLHGDIGVRYGPGLVADRMAGWLPSVLRARIEAGV